SSLPCDTLSYLLFSPTLRPPPRSTLFPYTTLFRSHSPESRDMSTLTATLSAESLEKAKAAIKALRQCILALAEKDKRVDRVMQLDRKSTRLNSSHDQISYAVFCLKKKKKKDNEDK